MKSLALSAIGALGSALILATVLAVSALALTGGMQP